MSDITEALKTDLAHIGDIQRASSGDVGRIAGLNNLKQALFHRLITVPGSLVHRPTYGVGALRWQNAPSVFTLQRKLAALIREQFMQDPRVEDVISTTISIPADNPQMTKIAVSVKPRGYSETTMVFQPFGGGV